MVDSATTLASMSAFADQLADGKVSADEFKARWAAYKRDKEALRAELSGMTRAALLERMSAFWAQRYKSDKKDRIVSAVLDDLAMQFVLEGAFSYSSGGRDPAIEARVNATTDETLAKYAAEVAESRKERAAKQEELKQAAVDPKTLDDFRVFIRANYKEGMSYQDVRMMLTPEQRARFDELAGEKSRTDRNYQKEAKSTDVKVAGQLVDGKIIETKHTKHGHDLFVVQLAERVAREDFDTLNAGAKKLGGGYSSYRGGGAVPRLPVPHQGCRRSICQAGRG